MSPKFGDRSHFNLVEFLHIKNFEMSELYGYHRIFHDEISEMIHSKRVNDLDDFLARSYIEKYLEGSIPFIREHVQTATDDFETAVNIFDEYYTKPNLTHPDSIFEIEDLRDSYHLLMGTNNFNPNGSEVSGFGRLLKIRADWYHMNALDYDKWNHSTRLLTAQHLRDQKIISKEDESRLAFQGGFFLSKHIGRKNLPDIQDDEYSAKMRRLISSLKETGYPIVEYYDLYGENLIRTTTPDRAVLIEYIRDVMIS